MRAIVIGAVESSRVAIETIASTEGWTIPAVVSLPTALATRHADFVDLEDAANAAGARMLRVRNVNDADALEAIAETRPDFIFVIGWSQICGPAFRALLPDRIIGYHPAALPRLRGRAVIPWTILADEPITGGTLFWIDGGVDTGAILAQRFFHVAPDETATTLYARHMEELRAMLGEALAALASGAPPRLVQDERHASWAARRTPADGHLDWSRPAAEIERLIRAVTHPYPGASTLAGTSPLTIWAARFDPGGARHRATPGQVIAIDGETFTVMCGDGAALTVTEWTGPDGAGPRQHGRLTAPGKPLPHA